MRKIIVLVFVIGWMKFDSLAGDIQYAVKSIPDSLLKNAHVVKRYEEVRFEFVDVDKARYYHKYVLTILDENGDRYARAIEAYDKKFFSMPSIDGRLYDANGTKIKTLKNSDIEDRSGTSEISLAEDTRIKHHSFYHKIYPYTVEYEIETRYNGTMFFPNWDPVDYYDCSVERSRLVVICPKDYALRFKALNYSSLPVQTSDNRENTFSWEIKNFAAIKSEYGLGSWPEIAPMVYLGPSDFEMQEYKGNMSSWENLAKFTQDLRVGRDQLPPEIKQKVHQLTDQLTDPKQKIAKLYEFMQLNTRYISIQLGIGGWQPFDATYVANKRYGDCKALSNYMYSLLKEAGIKSLYTLVKAGDWNTFFIPDFPMQQFNHVILCVPLQKDTTWLECTSQTLPAGYLSGFTANRYVLLVDENGGKLVKTPKYGLKDNLELRYTDAVIDAEGNMTATSKTDYHGLQQDDIYELINRESKEKILEKLKKNIDLPQYDVVSFDYQQQKIASPVVSEKLQLTANSYAQVSGKRLFISPNILTKTARKLSPDETRKYDLVLNFEFWDVDTVTISIPPGYRPEAVPQPVSIDSKFGRYKSSVKMEADKIYYYRSYEHLGGRFPPSAYNELVKFYDQVYKADRNKVVMVKPE